MLYYLFKEQNNVMFSYKNPLLNGFARESKYSIL